MKLKTLLSKLDGNYYLWLTVNSEVSLSADTDYMKLLIKAGDSRGNLVVSKWAIDNRNENIRLIVDLKVK